MHALTLDDKIHNARSLQYQQTPKLRPRIIEHKIVEKCGDVAAGGCFHHCDPSDLTLEMKDR